MLNDLMRSKPSFSADVFGGKVYQSKFMWSPKSYNTIIQLQLVTMEVWKQ
jgi:hypothetical protein